MDMFFKVSLSLEINAEIFYGRNGMIFGIFQNKTERKWMGYKRNKNDHDRSQKFAFLQSSEGKLTSLVCGPPFE